MKKECFSLKKKQSERTYSPLSFISGSTGIYDSKQLVYPFSLDIPKDFVSESSIFEMEETLENKLSSKKKQNQIIRQLVERESISNFPILFDQKREQEEISRNLEYSLEFQERALARKKRSLSANQQEYLNRLMLNSKEYSKKRLSSQNSIERLVMQSDKSKNEKELYNSVLKRHSMQIYELSPKKKENKKHKKDDSNSNHQVILKKVNKEFKESYHFANSSFKDQLSTQRRNAWMKEKSVQQMIHESPMKIISDQTNITISPNTFELSKDLSFHNQINSNRNSNNHNLENHLKEGNPFSKLFSHQLEDGAVEIKKCRQINKCLHQMDIFYCSICNRKIKSKKL